MDSILNENIYFIKNSNIESENIEIEEDSENEIDQVSVWIKEKDTYIPAISFITTDNLPPGFYTLSINSRTGEYNCNKLSIISDQLFTFTDNHITELISEIQNFWGKKDIYKKHNIIHKRGILLEGYAGTGKSSLITLLSIELIKSGGIVFKISDVRNFLQYVTFIKNYFRKIQPETPVITIIEDIELYSDISDTILDFMDGKTSIDNHVIIATSNNLSEIPDTFLRPSRLDYRIEVPLSDETMRREYFANMKVPEEDIETLVELSDKFSLAELKELFISVYILGKNIEDSVSRIRDPKSKVNYLSSNPRGNSFGI